MKKSFKKIGSSGSLNYTFKQQSDRFCSTPAMLALIAALGVWLIQARTTLGFEMRAVGANPAAARFAGMPVNSVLSVIGLGASSWAEADADSAKGCNRGAKSLEEFQLQRTKIVNAITEMDADLLGLMEMENNGFDEHAAISDLVQDELRLARPVRLGLRTLEAAEILEGLNEGEMVLLGSAVLPGQRVRVLTGPGALTRAGKGTKEDAGAAMTNAMGR